jgi:GNAT superfamily N-acetyltransferase
MEIEIRPAAPSEVQQLFELIVDSAEETNSRNEITTSPERLLADGFGPHPMYQALIAWEGAKPVGFTLWFPMYSSWKGRRSLYVEELFVRPFWRKRGMARRLFLAIEEAALHSSSNLAWECDRDRLDLRHFFSQMGAIDRSSKISFYMEEADMKTHIADTEKGAP